MAFKKQPCAFILFLSAISSTLLSFIISSCNANDCVGSGAISVYWGQHSDDYTEGSLKAACDSGNYNIVILESLIVFDDGSKTPILNLANHCGSVEHPCSELENQIKHCQDLGIKVFLSIGLALVKKPTTTNRDSNNIPITSSSSEDDVSVAKQLADYLLENFLSGNPGPLGSVSLDGIDLSDVGDTEHLHWDELVKAINESTTDRKIYLSASPQCVYPDYYLNTAIQTGLFDYIWVEFFYNNPSCIYSAGGAANLFKAWETWTSKVPNSKIFLGLTASKEIAGYIEPDVLKSDVLPGVKKASNYGGVMIWDRYSDINNDYSGQIKDSVPKSCRCVCDDEAASTHEFYGLQGGPSFPM